MASNKKNKLPDPSVERSAEFLQWLLNESERSAVILGGALADEELLALMLKVMPSPNKAEDRLFEPERPLGSFSSRITLAHRIGLIDDDFARGLNWVRDLRNHFAHRVEHAKLTDDAYRDRVTNIAGWVKAHHAYADVFEGTKRFNADISDPHRHWVVCVSAIVMRLRAARKNAAPLRSTVQARITVKDDEK
ncbi:hypothetical protein gp48 [Burkholderia phage KS9]|uniref:hypothetical protein gp48 n=1 Tax=Burkholderia phage KS9 TaxID=335797 RepID=UPI0001B07E51|nr:hypothetical protein [Burkholderia sp. BCC0322]YP_003090175.1 hypothetical protein gp48 [Burkholderia phage KS9]ACT83012.1 hypothetical protein gp48 [Burkholderia phage KS9]